MKGTANFYKQGSYNLICIRCGQKRKREDMQTEWTGIIVCKHCYDPRHPWTLPQPMPIDGLPVTDAYPRPRPRYIVEGLEGIQTWGFIYRTLQGYNNSDITWDGWNTYWGVSTDVPWSAENFPLE